MMDIPIDSLDYQDVIVYSVSVNTETIAKQLEDGAPSPNKRISRLNMGWTQAEAENGGKRVGGWGRDCF